MAMSNNDLPLKNCTITDVISLLAKINKIISSDEEEGKEDKTAWKTPNERLLSDKAICSFGKLL